MTDQQTPYEAAQAAAVMTVFGAGPNPAKLKLHAADCGAVRRAKYVGEPFETTAAFVAAEWSAGRAHDCAGRAQHRAAVTVLNGASK